jgi:hypothetical protein
VSFLLDPPLLVASGAAVEAALGESRAARVAERLLVAGFVAGSVALYLDRPFTRPIWQAFRARSGRDFMLNSGVFRFDAEHAGPRTHAAAATLFLAYPAFARLGRELVRRRRRV